MTSTNSVIAANRFGLGARPGELAAAGNDPQGWLEAQLGGPGPQPAGQLADTATILEAFFALRQRRAQSTSAAPGSQAPDPVLRVRDSVLPHYITQAEARVRLAAGTDQPFRERLVHFWSNHFAVSVDKIACLGIAGSFENEAIRPHVTGTFAALLKGAVQHPALILYLDNQASIGPHSRLGTRVQRRANQERKIDINENLAREILELHTLGVDGGYQQADVTEFARALTGWSVGGGPGPLGSGQPGIFLFRENLHEPGTRMILGARYGEEGLRQGERVLETLARHPATARHVATKLARHFLTDDPPAASIERLTTAWTGSDGDLPTVYRALIREAVSGMEQATKLKTPWDYVISAYRGLDFVPAIPRALLAPFELLGQRIWSPGSPAGWPDTAAAWDGADALLKRIEWADAVGDRMAGAGTPVETAANLLGDTLSARTRVALSQAESTAQAFALLLASPDFMRR